MLKIKLVGVLLATIGLIFSLGCSATEKLDGTLEESISDLDAYSLGIDTTSVQSTLTTTPAHIVCDMQGILSVDADVKIPSSLKQIANFTGQRLLLIPDQVVPLFFQNSSPDIETNTYNNNPWYTCQSSEGNLSFGLGSLDFNSFIDDPGYYDLALLYCSTPTAMQSTFADEHLSSLKVDEAVDKVRSLVRSLDMEPCGEATTCALSVTKLNELAEENRANTSHDDMFTLTEDDINRVYTEDDEVCVVRFRLGYDGIPITTSSYSDGKSDRYYLGSYVEAWVTKKGIVRMRLSEAINNPAPSDQATSIVPLDKALVLAAKKYQGVISESSIAIKEIRFEYVPRPQDDNSDSMRYVPTWYFSPGEEAERYAPSIRVDAISGEVF